MNQELEQFLQFFVDYRQKDWPEWLASAEFAINNKSTFSNKGISIYGKSWEKNENKSRYQEEGKSGESNGVCRKNEEGTRGSRGSIDEGTRRDETTSR